MLTDVSRLAPHETPSQDIILLGHSMGGILNSEVVLTTSYALGTAQRFKHNILGTINFDTPFLGMHYGVVGSGLGSLFRKSPEASRSPSPARHSSHDVLSPHRPHSQTDATLSTTHTQSDLQSEPSPQDLTPQASNASLTPDLVAQTSSTLSVPANDPNFDPVFPNDTVIKKRTGWANAWHFVNKHSDNLVNAAVSYATSHLEFGGAMADYRKLKNRYERIRALEDGNRGTRIRFVNYWTASTGRAKRKAEKGEHDDTKATHPSSLERSLSGLSLAEGGDGPVSISPRISVDTPKEIADSGQPAQIPNSIGPDHQSEAETTHTSVQDTHMSIEHVAEVKSSAHRSSPSTGSVTNFDLRNAATTASSLTDPKANTSEQFLEPHMRSSSQRLESLASDVNQSDVEHSEISRGRNMFNEHEQATYSSAQPVTRLAERKSGKGDLEERSGKPAKERKFCNLPPKVNGERDPCWVKVFMPNVDEVGAHCGLFFAEEDPERYEIFVQDVCLRVIDWLS